MTNTEKPQSNNEEKLQAFISNLTENLFEMCSIIDPTDEIRSRYVSGYGYMGVDQYDAYMDEIAAEIVQYD